mgnify:CR=1 FL=1
MQSFSQASDLIFLKKKKKKRIVHIGWFCYSETSSHSTFIPRVSHSEDTWVPRSSELDQVGGFSIVGVARYDRDRVHTKILTRAVQQRCWSDRDCSEVSRPRGRRSRGSAHVTRRIHERKVCDSPSVIYGRAWARGVCHRTLIKFVAAT